MTISNWQKHFFSYKYEILFVALLSHLFIGILITDFTFQAKYIWPINMLFLGWSSTSIIVNTGKWKKLFRNAMIFFVFTIPILFQFSGSSMQYFIYYNAFFELFFAFVFYEILVFLIKPSYINFDVISAAACGYFLLIEIALFLFQHIEFINPHSFQNLDKSHPAKTAIDFVYFSSVTLTSIGFGDIVPIKYQAKLITSLFGIFGQAYSVILVGIIISKFSSKKDDSIHHKTLE